MRGHDMLCACELCHLQPKASSTPGCNRENSPDTHIALKLVVTVHVCFVGGADQLASGHSPILLVP